MSAFPAITPVRRPRKRIASAHSTVQRGDALARLTHDVERDGRWYVGQLQEMPEVISQGRTLAELHRNIRDGYELFQRDRRAAARR